LVLLTVLNLKSVSFLKCSLYDGIRFELFEEYSELFTHFDDDAKFIADMNCNNIQCLYPNSECWYNMWSHC